MQSSVIARRVNIMSTDNSKCLDFRNLQCETNNKDKWILKELSGRFPQGSLIAVIGPSGSGKTTLLNILSGYHTLNATYDTLQYNGADTNFGALASISCYLTQDIHLNDLLSVEENMHFAADFKLGGRSRDEKTSIITEILDSFGLSSLRQDRAGNLSGGERKRLALALEMISDPRIIYLDEPTTGLDISATHQILDYLKKIAATGRTVICSIHQVCARHFELFDWAYVIADGECAFQGRPQGLVPYLKNIGFPCDIYHNPADFIVELCCGDFGLDKAQHLINACRNIAETFEPSQNNYNQNDESSKATNSSDSTSSPSSKFTTLLKREYVKTHRNYILTYIRIFGSAFMSLCVGLIFYDIGADADKTFSIYNLALAVNTTVVMNGLFSQILTFPSQMEVVKREVYNGYYTIGQYYLTMAILDLPVTIATILTTSIAPYYLVGLPMTMDRIMVFMLFCLAVGMTANASGFLLGTTLSLNDAIFVTSATHIMLLSISGFGILPQDMPYILGEVSRFIYLRRGVQGTLISIFGLTPRKLHCDAEAEYCFFSNSHRFLKELHIDPYDIATPFCVILCWYVVIRVITYYAMRRRLSII